jgi:hypothetical protein
VRIRRLDRVVAAWLLTVLAATLALLARPSSASALDSYDIHATVRYGCGQDAGEDNFVEVGLKVDKWKGQERELVLQVGVAGPGSTDTEVFPEGGPSLVTLDETATKVRLAGPVHDGDHVFLRQLDQPGVITLPLKPTCHRIKPTNFGLDSPTVRVAPRSCSPAGHANLKVTLDNPNDVDRRLQKMGIEQIDYTVLLVRSDGVLAGADPVGTLVSFDEPSASVITLSQLVPKPAMYQVRVIGPDGAVVNSSHIRLSCASTGGPGPSSPSRPTPSVPSSPTGSATPSTSRPAPSSSHPAPSSSHPAPSSSHPSTPGRTPTGASHRPPTASSTASTPVPSSTVSAVPTRSTPVRVVTRTPAQLPPASSTGASSSQASQPAPGTTSTPPSPSSPPESNSAGPGTSGSAPAPSPSSSVIQLVEPRSGYRGVPVFQKDIALVLLAFCTGMVGLVGSSVVAARRR